MTEGVSLDDVVETFSDPELVPHGYLDLKFPQFQGTGQLDQLHSSASKLLSELDHNSQELTWELRGLVEGLKKSKRRLNNEIELLRDDVQNLNNSIQSSSEEIFKELKETQKSNILKKIERLETVKQKMIDIQNVLLEANSFDEQATRNEITAMVAEGNIEGALQKMDKYSKLCGVWKGTALYPQRQKFLANLKKIIESGSKNGQTLGSNEFQSPERVSSPYLSDNSDGDAYSRIIGQLQRKIF